MWKSRRERILAAIGDEMLTPLEIKAAVNANVRWWQKMSLIGVYDLLEDLQMHGMVKSRWEPKGVGAPRRIYWQPDSD